MKEKISFVIPCYNSEGTLRIVVGKIIALMNRKVDYDYEIILVDDYSTDNVLQEIKRLNRENPRIKGLSLSKNFGQHAALMAGYRHCSGTIILSLDDDGETPVEEAFSLINAVENGFDVAIAKYSQNKHSLFRQFGTWLNNKMLQSMMNKPSTLTVTSYWCAKKYIIDEILHYTNAFPYISGLIFRSTCSIVNVDVKHETRIAGESGYSLHKLISLWLNGYTAFSVKPLRVATVCGFLCAIFGFIYGIGIIIHYYITATVPMGYSSIMAVLLFIGGTIMLMLGMVGEYLGRTYISINNAPQYVVKETIGVINEKNE